MSAEIRIIKKYPNRRLYDTELGAYITLNDVKQLVLDHVDFKVIDARTNDDLTQLTLLQIIMEEETQSPSLFTIKMLQQFIRFYHDNSQNVWRPYLEQTLQFFQQQKEFFMHEWQPSQPFFDPELMQKWTEMQKKWLQEFMVKPSHKK